LKKLDFVMQPQEQTEWCWAAVAASIANFYARNNQSKQCDVVNKTLRRTDCCRDGSSDFCNQQVDVDTALSRVGHLQRKQPGQPDFNIVVAEMNAGRPLAVRILWSGGGGHVIVVYGATNDRKVNVADPENANDMVLIPFDDFVYKDIGSWDKSFFTRSKSS
jgi:ABC-type bacteriocin/lantibiotic exporter with double-glycine peptidase domain